MSAVHNITWRALPERFGKWNSVWERFERLSKGGTLTLFTLFRRLIMHWNRDPLA
ncbi:transposase [Martelella endophytica]|uniref:transposase n=1 Tax=Martelella endophytica TaxID=1486262 RepID=UPI0009E52FEE